MNETEYYSSEGFANTAFSFLIVLCSLSSIILPVLIYTVITKSTKEMSSFRLFLCCEIFWSYAFGLYLSMIHPVIYFPHIMGRITGPLNVLCTPQGCNIVIELLFFIGAGYGQSLFVIVLFRLWRLTSMSANYIFNTRIRILILLFALLLPTTIFVTPVAMARVDVNKGLPLLLKTHPHLAFLNSYKNQLVIYNNPENNDFWVKYIVTLLSCTMLSIVIGSVFLLSLITWLTFQNKDKMTPHRFKLSVMLLKTTVVQVVLGILLLVVPLCTAVGAVMLQYRYANNVVFIMAMTTSTHSTIEFCSIFYMVKPYRNFIMEQMKKVKKLCYGESDIDVSSINTVAQRLRYRRLRPSSVSSQQSLFSL